MVLPWCIKYAIMLKFLHTADIHLGAKFKYLGQKAVDHREQLKKTFSVVINKAIEEKVDIFLIAGDLFDSNNISASITEFVKSQFKILQDNSIQVCIVPGTHDVLDNNSVYKREKLSEELSNVFILSDDTKKRYPNLDLTVWGKPNTSSKSNESPIIKLGDSSTKYNILMAHGSVQIQGKSAKDDYPIALDEIKDCEMDYVALGHWHSMGDYSQSGVKCFYSGSPEMIDLGQNGAGNVILGAIEEKGNAIIEPVKVGIISSVNTEIDLGQIENEEMLKKRILENHDKNLVKIVELKGLASPHVFIDPVKLEQELAEEFFRIKIINNSHTRLELIDEKDYPEELVIGRFVRLMKQKIDESKDEVEKRRLEQALNIGLMELSGKNVI